ncbi:MAG: SAM-dependent methyltransferase [Planctomycetaceae bacterium]|nr:SAM-dependent methyltransferase [Planctomycetaceae bacterium]
MLARVLEPEVMDTAEDARDYDAMDHSAVNQLFAAEFLEVWDGTSPILDVGTGTAQIPIELCRLHASLIEASREAIPHVSTPVWGELRIVAIDLADHMLTLARQNVERANLTSQIQLEKADAKGFAYPDRHFGAVISNSIIHHIPDPSCCFAQMHRVCALEGTVFVRDLLRPSSSATLEHIVNTYAAGANDHQRRLFAESLHAALTLDEVRAFVGTLGYPPESVQQTSDRHWTWADIRRV